MMWLVAVVAAACVMLVSLHGLTGTVGVNGQLPQWWLVVKGLMLIVAGAYVVTIAVISAREGRRAAARAAAARAEAEARGRKGGRAARR